MWPVFMLATLADAVIGRLLPPSGDGQAVMSALLLGLILNLLAIVVVSRPTAVVLRRRRPDLPLVVARDYAGTAVIATVTAALLAVGVVHHQRIVSDQRALDDAVVRAQAFIGARAPAEFRQNVALVNMFAIQPGRLYRACVPSGRDARTYCVVVDTTRPFPGGVTFSGYEPNSIFSEGAN